MSRWSREKHRRETARIQSIRDRLVNRIIRSVENKLMYGTSNPDERLAPYRHIGIVDHITPSEYKKLSEKKGTNNGN